MNAIQSFQVRKNIKFLSLVGIEENFSSQRLLCSWHVQRNLISGFSGLQKKDKELYQDAIHLPFITRTNKFEEVISKLQNTDNITEQTKAYLEKKLLNKHRWAKCFTKESFVVSVCTTSRVESLHKILALQLNSRSSQNETLDCFHKIERRQLMRLNEEIKEVFDEGFNTEFFRHKFISNNKIANCALMDQFKKIYTPYIAKKLENKICKSLNYIYEELSIDQRYFITKVVLYL